MPGNAGERCEQLGGKEYPVKIAAEKWQGWDNVANVDKQISQPGGDHTCQQLLADTQH